MPGSNPTGKRLTVAERKRRQREKLREAGLSAVEVWIPPDHRPLLKKIELGLREGIVPSLPDSTTTVQIGDAISIPTLCDTLNDLTSANGYSFSASILSGNEALEVVVEDRVEFPILVWIDGAQMIAVTHLWDEAQIVDSRRTELLSALLQLNISLPLSSFGIIREDFVIFGALSSSSTLHSITTELEMLSDNTLDAVEFVAPFLKSDNGEAT